MDADSYYTVSLAATQDASLGWHSDDDDAYDSVICAISPGNSSIAIAGVGEVHYLGVGSFIMFPSFLYHRTLRVEPAVEDGAAWKLAAFFT